MNVKGYHDEVKRLVGETVRLSGISPKSAGDQERLILGAYCFGVINGYSLEQKAEPVHVQAALISAAVQFLGYAPETAAQLCDFLIQSTNRDFHPTVYAIIHRGMEGYYLLKENKRQALTRDVREIVEVVASSSEDDDA